MRVTLDHLRRYAIARTLFKPTTLGRAITKLGFVQADPIRAPARAQDLILRHRVLDYAAGDLERRYPQLPIEEDFFVNYGFLPRVHQELMHPRTARTPWPAKRARQAQAVLEFIRRHGPVHPRVVDAHFAHGKVTNWFGGSSNATTQLLDEMHYRGLVKVARRDSGTRIYAVRPPTVRPTDADDRRRVDALVDLVLNKYAPLPAPSFGLLLSLLCRGVPQFRHERAAALKRAKERAAHVCLDGVDWYWPAGESPAAARWRFDDSVRLLAPFDPIVWDRRRFSLFWDWTYRFEAYTPAPKRKLGYYALPMVWRAAVVGWSTITVVDGALQTSVGYAAGQPPRDREFAGALDAELARIRRFLRLDARPRHHRLERPTTVS